MPRTRWLTSAEACARLDVKRATLYTYVSRGAIRCAGEGRTRRYHGDDVERVATRADARKGHTAVAAGALRWGEAVLDTALTSVGSDGFTYRGRSVPAIARAREPFESVADWLWSAPESERWPETISPALRVDRALPLIERLIDATISLGRAEGGVWPDESGERARARRLLRAMAASLAPRPIESTGRIAELVARSFGVEPSRASLFDVALALCADHELNASSFTARVAASAGADLHGCVTAALQAVKGDRHGGMCDLIESLLARDEDLAVRVSAGEALPGFGHTLYPEGDPRVPPLFEAIETLGVKSERYTRARRFIDEGARLTGEAPCIDAGLVVMSVALDLPRGAATAIFALGRVAGHVAHALEQRRSGALLRPRARYNTGPR